MTEARLLAALSALKDAEFKLQLLATRLRAVCRDTDRDLRAVRQAIALVVEAEE